MIWISNIKQCFVDLERIVNLTDSDENGTEKNFESKEKKHRPGHVAEWLPQLTKSGYKNRR